MTPPSQSPWKRLGRSLLGFGRPAPKQVDIPSCYALLQITADPAKCDLCGECAQVCPVQIDLPAYIAKQESVKATSCILCQSCVNTCAQHALSVTTARDLYSDKGSRSR